MGGIGGKGGIGKEGRKERRNGRLTRPGCLTFTADTRHVTTPRIWAYKRGHALEDIEGSYGCL